MIVFIAAAVIMYAVYRGLIFYAGWYAAWENSQRHGMSYYGKPLAERRRFRRQIRLYSGLMPAVVALERSFRASSKKVPAIPSLEFENIAVPSYSCTKQSMEKARAYRPTADDVFVVTQMKCGTTWMQQIVFEILSRGKGDLTDSGFGHLYAMSPWLESVDGVSVEQAPLIGPEKKRLIKTHLPATFFSPAAKYIYVMRHPVSCFASILDYFRLMSGSLMPPRETILDWYCSPRMWFTPWPEHVSGWWTKSREASNILFMVYEDMKQDLPAAIRRTAEFLGVRLSEEELAAVERKSCFEAMKAGEEYFEMCPPNFCSVRESYFVDGTAQRHRSVTGADREKIFGFCESRLKGDVAGLIARYRDKT